MLVGTSKCVHLEHAVYIQNDVQQQEHIMKKGGRGEERVYILLVLPTPNLLLNLASMNLVCIQIAVHDSRASGAYTILLTAVLPQSHLNCQLEQSEKCSARLTKQQSEAIRASATKR